MPLAPGTRFGPYEIVAPLGAGGMGEVYRAHDARLKRAVAIKVLPAAMAEDREALRRLEQEARAVAALSHPNLLTVFDVGATPEGAPYLVCELLEGATLRERLAGGALPQRKAVDYGVQLARGLAAAHAKGIVHRDLKPDNIFCTDDGRVKILDFGLAKWAEGAATDDKTAAAGEGTAAGLVLGTVGYMSPEQARGKAADARSDIFSLGCVLYEMLAGRRAFRGDSAADVISAILREEPPELTTTNAAIPPVLERIVRHCMEKEPPLRFQSAGDIAFALDSLSQASTSTSTGALLGAELASAPFFSRRRLGIGAVGLSGLILAVAATWMWAGARARFQPPTFERVTYQQGDITSARFMPDGQGVIGAARWNEAAKSSIFTSRFDSIGTQAPGVPADWVLAVANGEAALLQGNHALTGYTEVGTLARMPLSGGAPRAVLDEVQYADYSPTAGDLAITRFHPENTTFTLEYPVGNVLYRTNGWIGEPRFSRGGQRIAFIEHPVMGDDAGSVAVVDLRGKVATLTPHFETAQGLAWSPSGSEVWFTAGHTAHRALYAATLGGRVRLLLQAPGGLTLEDVRSDGRVLMASIRERLFLKLVTANDLRPRDVSVLDWPFMAILSADGKQFLVDDDDAGPRYSTYLRAADGSAPIRLGDGDAFALSPDGQWALSLLPEAPSQLMLLPTGVGTPRQLTHSAIAFVAGNWLPDGRAVLAIGIQPGQRPRDYRIALDGSVQPVTPEGVVGTVITPDGKSVLARPSDSHGADALYPLAGGAPVRAPGLQPGDGPLRFSADGQSLFVNRLPPATTSTLIDLSSQVYRINLRTGQRELLFTIAPDTAAGATQAHATSISADGKSLAYGYSRRLSTLYLVSGVR